MECFGTNSFSSSSQTADSGCSNDIGGLTSIYVFKEVNPAEERFYPDQVLTANEATAFCKTVGGLSTRYANKDTNGAKEKGLSLLISFYVTANAILSPKSRMNRKHVTTKIKFCIVAIMLSLFKLIIGDIERKHFFQCFDCNVH